MRPTNGLIPIAEVQMKFAIGKRVVAIAATAIAVLGGVIATPGAAQATGTTCKTLSVTGNWQGFSIIPRMTVPICYNGSSVWVNGNVTPGVTTFGYTVGGYDWYGTYGSGGWLGAGENFFASAYFGGASFYCTPRWGINAWGNVVSYSRNC